MKAHRVPHLCRARRTAGFSLVEVTLALGIVAFCLVSLLGLFAVGLESSRHSGRDTALSEVAARLINEWSRPGASLPSSGFVDHDGEVNSSEGIYAYEIVIAPVTSATVLPVSDNLQRISVTFRWPVGAATAHQETLAFHSALFNPASGGATP